MQERTEGSKIRMDRTEEKDNKDGEKSQRRKEAMKDVKMGQRKKGNMKGGLMKQRRHRSDEDCKEVKSRGA